MSDTVRRLLMSADGFESLLVIVCTGLFGGGLIAWLTLRKSLRRRRLGLVVSAAGPVIFVLWRWLAGLTNPSDGGARNGLVEVRVLLAYLAGVIAVAAIGGVAAGLWVRRADK